MAPAPTRHDRGVGSSALIGLGAVVGPVLLLFVLTASDNRRWSAKWLLRRWWGGCSWSCPTPHEHLTDADRDAWFGGNGGC